MIYEELLIESEKSGIKIKEKSLKYGFKGLYKNAKVIINSNIKTNNEKSCVLAEELGHHFKTVGNIVDQSNQSNKKQEKIARNWAYEKLVGIVQIINAFKDGINTRYEMAEYLNVTEDFLEDAIQHYREKYGEYYRIDCYMIYFYPFFGIMKIF
ncbi:MAG: ImmA/IrrE family metallo-endopeptidase [Bacillota bacterium]|nr:ImmA/IrrE family metallo-endopeptidase [Bacillota bacterium]